jgi:hypothetical protein
MTNVKEVYLTIDQFNKDLEDCLTIVSEPSKRKPYYVCQYVSPALYKSIVYVFIVK